MRLFRQHLLTVALLVVVGTAQAAEPPTFDRDVLPILSDKCFQCHGPDAETRAADLRLDERDAVLAVGAIVPGDAEQSEIIARITSTDPDVVMPPPEKSKPLTAAQFETLRAWIESGAEYTQHWAFRNLPETVQVPEVEGDEWGRTEIDSFVSAKSRSVGLAPAEEAAPLRLLRRVSFALTGLPPSPERIAKFEAAVERDGVDRAYAAAVDELLSDPAFGEHQAVAWLDAARYADSYGYQSDQLATYWPYRDWVVRSFNSNLPFDQFLTWQLAGDLFPNPTRDQKLATAFCRLHRLTNEGGSIPEEWLVENAADRVHTFGSAMLGLTLECARCHDHKYDPIAQRDYYSLMAVFNSIDENGLYDHSAKTPAPALMLPTDEQQARLTETRRRVDELEAQLAELPPNDEPEFSAWLSTATAAGLQTTLDQSLVGQLTFDEPIETLRNSAPGSKAERFAAPGCAQVAGVKGSAVEFNGDDGVPLTGLLSVERHQPFALDLWVRDTVQSPAPVVLLHDTTGTDVGYNGFDIMLVGGQVEARLYRVWPGNGIGVRTKTALAKAEWAHLAVVYDGSSRAEGISIYIGGERVETEVLRNKLVKSIQVGDVVERPNGIGARFRDRGFVGGAVDELRIFNRELAPLEVRALHVPDAFKNARDDSMEHHEELVEAWRLTSNPRKLDLRNRLTTARNELRQAEDQVLEVSVMEELPTPRPTYLLARGAYDAPKTDETKVSRDVFAAMLPKWPADAPRNRLGLAQWLTAPAHPLTARVAVNRVWATFFGRGLVTTPENFGRQGAAPIHQELLDWLARDFISSGWDTKRLYRQIALSATYRQASRLNPELRERDSQNEFFARGPSFRLSGEQLRDTALEAAGLLVRTAGGPPVSPYQPGPDLWREANSMSPPYQESVGRDLYRRSLYSVWKRTVPLPNMLTFDAPTREVCVMARSRTNTPLQALVLLNDEQFVEAARALAERVRGEHAELTAQIDAAFVRLVGRPPSDVEEKLLTELYNEQRAQFEKTPEDAQKLLAIGESKTESSAPPEEIAALTVVCQTILNLDETITSR